MQHLGLISNLLHQSPEVYRGPPGRTTLRSSTLKLRISLGSSPLPSSICGPGSCHQRAWYLHLLRFASH